MNMFSIIGIDYFHYEEIKLSTYIAWINNNTKTPKEAQLCLINQSLQKYFMAELSSINIRFVTHLQLFKKPLTPQQKLDLYFDYLKKFDVVFPTALKPKVTQKTTKIYKYNPKQKNFN